MKDPELVSTQKLEDGNTLRMYFGTDDTESNLVIAFVLNDYKFEVLLDTWDKVQMDLSNALMKVAQEMAKVKGDEKFMNILGKMNEIRDETFDYIKKSDENEMKEGCEKHE